VSSLFLEGVSAVVAAVIVFCGSIFLLLAMVVGGRLAYFVTASITLVVVLIMTVVWSINPLGPVGQLAKWDPVAIGPDAAQLDFGPAASYPDPPWRKVDTEDAVEAAQASELEAESTDVLESALADERLSTFESVSDAAVDTDLTRLIDQGGRLYGAVTIEPLEGKQGTPTVAVLSYDPGNPLGPPRIIAAGTFVLLALHLFGLSRAERRAAPALGRRTS
jgi:hypothetical protein